MEYSLLMQKMRSNSVVKDSFVDFGIVCTDVPFLPFGEAKELPTREWPDEDGEDTYIPDRIPIDAYDFEIEFCYKGNRSTAYGKIRSFFEYITGMDNNGSALKIYSPYTGIGRQNIHFKSISDFDFGKSNIDESVVFSVTFRVTDPVTDVTLTK